MRTQTVVFVTNRRARTVQGRLHMAVLLMILLNAAVWGGVIALLRGFISL